MKIIIAGGRDFNDVEVLEEGFKEFLSTLGSPEGVSVVSGLARGADTLGKQMAERMEMPVHEFPADWKYHGKAAGHIRNRQMGDYADVLLAFWDGESRGTKGMIDYMVKLNKPVKVVYY